jgi:hypothetical protein
LYQHGSAATEETEGRAIVCPGRTGLAKRLPYNNLIFFADILLRKDDPFALVNFPDAA